MKYEYGNLGELLEKCSRYGIRRENRTTVIDRFVFTSNSHDTGITVNCNIKHPETGELYPIISGTYWYSEAQYGWNTFTWKRGKWDDALRIAIQTLKDEVQAEECRRNREKMRLDGQERETEQSTQRRFEEIF